MFFMAYIGWRFPPLSGGTRQTYTSNDIEGFKGEELIDNLARETCQNSLDAKCKNVKKPVKVVFELRHISTRKYKAIKEYRNCLDGCEKYWGNDMDTRLKQFLTEAGETLNKQEIPILTVSDYNTTGLSGNQSRDISSPWEALTGSDGMSVKNERDSSGSYGIGKNAPYACSSLSMVFYNTQASDGSAFIGVARLATISNKEGKPTQRIGKYQYNDDQNELWKPLYKDNQDEFKNLFTRNENGTDVIIVGFNQEDKWQSNIEKAILKNFFVSIKEKNLVVEIKDKDYDEVINDQNISEKIESHKDDKKMAATYQMYEAFINPAPIARTTLSILENTPYGEKNNVDVYVKADRSFKKTIGNFRSTGMLIRTYRKMIFQHYAAVVVVRGEKLGELLKDTEPPRHNRWDYKLISKAEKDKRNAARKAINDIEEQVGRFLKKQFRVATEDSTDAIGISEYLPDEQEGITASGQGDDALRVKVKVSRVVNKSADSGTTVTPGRTGKGKPSGGRTTNSGTGGKRGGHNPVKPGGKQPGTRQGAGKNILITPNLNAQRAYPLNSDQGLYKIIIRPTEDYDKLYIKCSARGEDGKTDSLDIERFRYGKKNINLQDCSEKIPGEKGMLAGPIQVRANTVAEFFVIFKDKGKYQLSLDLCAEVKR